MKYQGQILDGQMHGEGKLIYDNGEYYDGEWQRGKTTSSTVQIDTFDSNHILFHGIQESVTVVVNTYMPMVLSTSVTGRTTASKARAPVGTPTATSTPASGAMAASMARVPSTWPTVIDILVNGKMHADMVVVSTSIGELKLLLVTLSGIIQSLFLLIAY